jgi:hypothetical protein
MTEQHDEPRTEIAEAGESAAAPTETQAASGWRTVALGLAGVLVLVVVLIGTAPFWAALLSWAPAPAPAAGRSEPTPDPRIDRLEAAQQQGQQRRQQDEATANAALQTLDRRVGALEAKPSLPVSDVAELRQQVTKLSTTAADLAARVAAIDQAVHAQAVQAAVDTTDTAMVLVLLQIRGAVAAGRPFAAEYEALLGLARARPEVMAAAAALAEPAKTGVAGRAVLAGRLRELAGAIVAAAASPDAPENAGGAATGWGNEALSRLRGLVTIRRIDGSGQSRPGTGPEAPVKAAELALAGGDLDGAVAALDKLTGPAAAAAGPWLAMAKQRLAVEAALQRIETLLAARLGAPATAPATAPAGSPR